MGIMEYFKKYRSDFFPALFGVALAIIIVCTKYQTSTLGDSGYYITNGHKLLLGENVYKDGFRSGSFGSVALYLISIVLTNRVTEIIFQILNLIGPIVLVTILTWNKFKVLKYWPLLVLIAPSRELLVNHQINGVIYFLISISLVLGKSKIKYFYILSFLPAAIALDLKPHLVLPILLAFATTRKNMISILRVLITNLLMHLLIDIRVRQLTEFNWIQNLTSLSSSQEHTKWYEIYNIWPIVDMSPLPTNFTKMIGITTFVLILCLLPLIARKFGVIVSVSIALISPIIGLYCHLYDLAPFVVLVIIVAITNLTNIYFWALLNMAIVFRGPDGFSNWIILITVNVVVLMTLRKNRDNSIADGVKNCLLGFILYLVLTRTLVTYLSNEHILRSSLITLIAMLGIVSTSKILSQKENQK